MEFYSLFIKYTQMNKYKNCKGKCYHTSKMNLLGLCIIFIAVVFATENNYNGYNYQEYISKHFRQMQSELHGNMRGRYDNDKDNITKENHKINEDKGLYEKPNEYVLTNNKRNDNSQNLRKNLDDYKHECDLKSDSNKGCKNVKNYEKDRYEDDTLYKDYVNNKGDLTLNNYQDGYNNIDQYINLLGLANNDTEDIFRPCSLEDWECIRNYLSENSKCKPTYGPIPDPLYFERNIVYFPYVNVTNVRTRLRVSGLSSVKVGEFYVNKNTGNLVLALNFQNLTQYTPQTYVRYKRTAKESIVLSDFAAIMFKSGTFTAVIPKVPHLRLGLADVHANIDDAAPNLIFGPGAYNSTDPDVVSAFAELSVTLPILTREEFLLTSQLYTLIYIQAYLCDFGLKLYSI